MRTDVKRKLIVLGIDGMDPVLLAKYIDQGLVPNLAKLAENGQFRPLATTNPPQSPVAWSTFSTGMDASGHGIYDFVHRDPHDLEPYLSTSRTEQADTVDVGGIVVPLSSAETHLLREGRTFWQDLEDARIPATVVKMPANFPPAESRTNESMSGMGTPDLLGTYGTFQVITDDPSLVGRSLNGGIVQAIDWSDSGLGRAALAGPPDPLSTGGQLLSMGVDVVRDHERPVALVRFGDRSVMLQPGEWSEWVPVGFDPGVLGGEIGGMVRLYLKSLRPHLSIYVSPINLDPLDPAMPVSSPDSYATELAESIGRYYTQGMAQDTKALSAGVLTDDEFLSQAQLVFDERLELLHYELDRFESGALFFYISSIDQLSHVYFRSLDPDAPAKDRAYADVIPNLYQRVDRAVGEVMARVGDDTDIVIVSDHGFAPYRTKVHLNTWLAQRGYLTLLPPERVQPGPLGHIDWSATQAYALGLNQLFVNLRGREASGVVPPSEREVLLRRLTRELESFRDPETGQRVVTSAVEPPRGAFIERAPDLIVGYNRGYRSSDESAMGQVGSVVLEPNTDKWSGDHCMDPRFVPGALLSTAALSDDDMGLIDLAPSILDYFGVAPPAAMTGKVIWANTN